MSHVVAGGARTLHGKGAEMTDHLAAFRCHFKTLCGLVRFDMPSIAEQSLALLTAKGTAEAQALAAANGDMNSAGYQKASKKILQIYHKGVRALKAEDLEEKELTEKAQALATLDLTHQTYEKRYEFDAIDLAKSALRALDTDANWVTGKSGRHGGNKLRQHHGGPRGCFMITADKHTKIATLWAAESNTEELPDDMEGAREIEEEEGEEEDDDDENESALALLIASSGKTLADVKAMDAVAREAHAVKCNNDRAIRAADVTGLAAKMGCPASENTKGKRLEWMLKALA